MHLTMLGKFSDHEIQRRGGSDAQALLNQGLRDEAEKP